MSSIVIALILVLFGFILLTAEVFIPSFGVLFALSVASFSGGVFFAFKESDTIGFVFAFSVVILVPILGVILFRKLPDTAIGKKIILQTPQRGLAESVEVEDLERFRGKRGVAKTILRPSGVALIDGERIDVVTEGLMIEKNVAIKVVDVEGNRLVVRLDNLKDENES